MLGAQPHLLQQLHYPCVAGCLIKGAQVTQGLGDTSADAALRVECARRVLEHQLHGTLEGPCLFAAQLIDGLSGEGHQPLARGFQPEQQAGEGTFATAATAQQTKRFARMQLQVDAVEYLEPAAFVQQPAGVVAMTQIVGVQTNLVKIRACLVAGRYRPEHKNTDSPYPRREQFT